MKYGIKNEKILTSEEVLAILHRSASDIPNMLIRHCYFCFGKRKRKVIIFMRSDLESIISCTWRE